MYSGVQWDGPIRVSLPLLKMYELRCVDIDNHIIYTGERIGRSDTKASAATRTVASSNLGHGGPSLRAITVSREAAISHPRIADSYGWPLEFLTVPKTLQLMTLVSGLKTNKKKNNNNINI